MSGKLIAASIDIVVVPITVVLFFCFAVIIDS